MTSTTTHHLIQQAQDDGLLSAASAQALTTVDLGAQIQAGLGIDVEDVMASEVVLLTQLIDDSGSISSAGNAAAVRAGHNLVLDAVRGARQRDDVLAHARYLNGEVLYPYTLLDGARQMDAHNYQPSGGTPLYDAAVVLLGTVLAKAQEFAGSGVPARTVTLIITDGADMHSRRHCARDVAALVRDMTLTETHIVAAMGVDDGSTDFRAVFRDMGIDDRWILTPGNNASDIRQAFGVFSQSVVAVSQGAANFSKGALGGFGS